MNSLEILELIKEIYSHDLELYTAYANEFVTNDMLDGEYKILKKVENYINDNLDKMEVCYCGEK